MKDTQFIRYEDLKRMNMYEALDVKKLSFTGGNLKNIDFAKIKSGENMQNFRLSLPKGTKWESHFHDCIEKILVFRGRAKDTYNNKYLELQEPYEIKSY